MRYANILDPRFHYVPSNRTDVTITWRRFGFKVGDAGNSHSTSDSSETADSAAELGRKGSGLTVIEIKPCFAVPAV